MGTSNAQPSAPLKGDEAGLVEGGAHRSGLWQTPTPDKGELLGVDPRVVSLAEICLHLRCGRRQSAVSSLLRPRRPHTSLTEAQAEVDQLAHGMLLLGPVAAEDQGQ